MVLGEGEADAESHRVDQLDHLSNILISWLTVKRTNQHELKPSPSTINLDRCHRASSVLLFPTFWGLYYFFLLLGKIPTFSYFFRFLLKLIDKNAIFKPKIFLASLCSA